MNLVREVSILKKLIYELLKTGVGGDSKYKVTLSDSEPTSPTEGDVWIDTTTMIFYVYDSGEWK